LDRQLEREVRRRQRRPYIFSAEEIQKLFQTALAFPSPRASLRPQSLRTMLILAYCAGLRLGEIARLTIGDVRIEEGVIEIRETKFFKTRHLPLSPSAVAALRSYLAARKQSGAPSDGDSALFWQQQDRCGYARMTVEGLLARVFRNAGLKPPRPNGRVGPRIHDLRHYAEFRTMPSKFLLMQQQHGMTGLPERNSFFGLGIVGRAVTGF